MLSTGLLEFPRINEERGGRPEQCAVTRVVGPGLISNYVVCLFSLSSLCVTAIDSFWGELAVDLVTI